MFITLSNIIPIIIIFQSILFAFVLFTHKGPKKVSNTLLALFLITIAVQFGVILFTEIYDPQLNTQQIMCVFGFIYGPLILLYTQSLVYDYFSFKLISLIHFVPASVFLFGPLINCPLCGKFGYLLYVSIFIYVALSIVVINKYRAVVMNTQSMLIKSNFNWLKWIIVIFSVALFLDLIDQMIFRLDFIFGISIIHLTILILVNWMFYKGLKQPHIFLGISKADQFSYRESLEIDKESFDDVKSELNMITNHMVDKLPFTNPDLSINNLAHELELPARRLSYLINTYFNQNFMSYINQYRIEMAKHRFENPIDSGETILEVMYAVGFNSKSSFYPLFKQKTGLTPSEFKKNILHK